MMKPPADIDYPPVQVFTIRGLEELLERRLEGLRAAGISYEVVHLDEIGGDA